ncbi:MAG: hypothetical protein QXT93_10620 [Thermofilum sp.]
MVGKGIAPLAAVLILVAISAVASIITYVWVTSYMSTIKQVSEPSPLSEVLKIEASRYSNGRLHVAVRNVGSRTSTITALYILRQDRTTVFADTGFSVELEPGEEASIEVEVQLSPGTYTLKLVTTTGVEATTTLTWVAAQQPPPQQEPEKPQQPPPEQPRIVKVWIAVEPEGGGTTDPEPGEHEVQAGGIFSATAIPNEGYLFLYWLVNGEYYSSDASISITVYDDTSLTAVFEKQQDSPSFRITSWNSKISGPVGSDQTFNTEVKNVGRVAGTVQVRILNHDGGVVSESEVELQPGEAKTLQFTLKLPSARGEYTWRVIAVNTATGETDDEKTFTIEAKDLYLTKRNALYYTAFETMPSGWTSWGGSWTIATGKGRRSTNALQGSDNDGGPGGASLFHREIPSGAAYLAVQVLADTYQPDRLGLALAKITTPVNIYSANLDYRGRDSGFRIDYYDGRRWRTRVVSRFTPTRSGWYTIIIEWSSSTLVACVYDSTGTLIAQLSTSISGFTPERASLIVDRDAGYFDNFIISSVDPRYLQVTGLEQGWRIELYSGGTLIGSAVADANGVAQVTVVTDLIVVNARIVVKDSTGSVVIERTFTEIVGGDEYTYGS